MNQNQIKTIANQQSFRMYLIFYAGQLISILGSAVVSFTIIWWATTELGKEGSILFFSFSMFLGSLPAAILAPFIGVYIDRWNKKKVIAITDSSQAFITFILMIFFATNQINYVILLITTTIGGFNKIIHFTAVQTIMPSMVPPDKLSRMNSINFLLQSLIGIINPMMAAILIGYWTTVEILWLDIFTFAIAILFLMFIKVPRTSKVIENKEQRKSFIEDFKDGVKTIKKIDGLVSLLVLSLATSFLLAPVSVLNSVFIYYIHSGSEVELAQISSIVGIGVLLGSILSMIKKEWKHKIAISFGGLILMFIGVGVKALAPPGTFWLISIASLITFSIMPLFKVIIATNMQKVVPLDKRGRVFSIQIAFATVITPIAYIISGPISLLIGIRSLFLVCSILGFISTILFLLFSNLNIYRINGTNSNTKDLILEEMKYDKQAEDLIEEKKDNNLNG